MKNISKIAADAEAARRDELNKKTAWMYVTSEFLWEVLKYRCEATEYQCEQGEPILFITKADIEGSLPLCAGDGVIAEHDA